MENGQASCLDGEKIYWSKVWDILTGVTSLHAQKVFLRRTCIEKIKFLFLNCMRPFMKSIDKLCKWDIRSFTCGREEFEVNNDTTKYINVSFNAWVYSGTELLWASLLEEMWTKVEAEFGEYSVRFHRASIHLSNELESDDLETRQSKRMAAILVLKVKGYAYLCLSLLGMASIFFFHVKIADFGESLYQRIISQVALSSPLLLYIGSFVTKVLPELQKSRGKQILQEVQSFDDHKRADFSKKTGFMGEVKTEVGYLFDFLRTTHIRDEKHRVLRPVRLSIFVDDLDRCQPDTIMSVLEAVMLLLMVDAPLTCWLAIDSRVVVASIEKHYGDKFSEEGLDGYKFLDKIVQIPFCIPDLDSACKKNYMQKILVKNELDPLRVYARLKYLLHDAEFSEFRDLVDDNDSVFQKKEPTKTKDEPTKTEATRALVPVLDKMFRKGIVDGKKFGAMIKGPGDVHKAVVQRLKSNDALGEQLEEEFLHFISIGIQNILEGHIQKLKKNPSEPSNILSPTNSLSPINPGELNLTNDGSVSNPDGDPVARSVGAIAASEVVEYRLGGGYSELFQPMADKVEAEWFDNYADHFVGEPRKIKRIINSYMVSRFVADRMMATRADEVFQEKLLKLIILFEQWPYRMAWLLVVVENLQQEKHILTNLQQEELVENQPDNVQENDAQQAENQPDNERDVPVCETECPLTTIITKLSGSKNYLDLPLLKVYRLLVQGLIHSPDQSHFQLQRDGDPQVFEMLLSDISAPSNLKMKDIGLPGEIGSEKTLRPFAFNLQRHLIEKVQGYLDNCMLHLGTNTGDEMIGVYQKKAKFFNRKHPIFVP